MNEAHLELLTSPRWRDYLRHDVLPWISSELVPSDYAEIIEIGPGPGLVTDLLRPLTTRHVAVEIDPVLAESLRQRVGSSVDVICADATRCNLDSDQFTAAFCLTMIHHIPTCELQDALLAEVHRLLRPGGVLVGLDSLDGPTLQRFHHGDTWVPLRLSDMADRLAAAGFADVTVEEWNPPHRPGPKIRFIARTATPRSSSCSPTSDVRDARAAGDVA